MKRNVLVLGSGGFLGRHLLRALERSEDFVPVAGWHRTPLSGAPGVRQVQIDATSADVLAPALEGISGVVNCVSGGADTIISNGLAAINACERAPSKPRLIQLSSMAAYGGQVGLVSEAAPLLGDAGAYSAAKVAVEQAAIDQLHVVVLRPGCIYGPGSQQWSGRIARLLEWKRLGDLGAAGDGFSNLVHVDDVVAAILACLRLPSAAGYAYNLAANPNPRWNEYFIALGKALGAVPVRRIPRRQFELETKLLAPGLKLAELTLGRVGLLRRLIPDPIPPSLGRLWAQEIRLDSTRAERELGLRWTPLEKGIEDTVRWLRPG